MRISVGRNKEAPFSLQLEEDDKRTRNTKLAGWSLVLLIVYFTLFRVLVVLTTEVWEFIAVVTSTPAVREHTDVVYHTRKMAEEFASEKMRAITVAAATGLDSWREVPHELDSNQLLLELSGMTEKIAYLQETFSKSMSVGSAVGLTSLDLEDHMTSLRDNQKNVVQLTKEVHKRAHEIVKPRKDYDAPPEAVGDVVQRQRVHHKLRGMVGDILDVTDIKSLGWRLKAAGLLVDAAVDTEEAEEIVARFAERAASLEGAGEKVDQIKLSNEEIERIVKKIALSKKILPASDGGEICVSVETAIEVARALIERFFADRTGIPDYAMGPAGASVILPLTSETFEQSSITTKLFLGRESITGPYAAIDPVSRLGDCWPMKGSSGRLTVTLSRPVRVSMISIEHAPRVLLLNEGSSAPKMFTVVGYPRGWIIGPDSVGHTLVSSAEYKLDREDIQYFDVSEEYREVEYEAVALHVESNHGQDLFTCIYRMRVHGAPFTGESR